MSWIFGIINKFQETEPLVPLYVKQNFQNNFRFGNVSIFVGGNRNNIFYSGFESSESGWIVCGTGMTSNNSKTSILKNEDWDRVFSTVENIPATIDGHFVLLKCDDRNIYINTDVLGLRDIYLKESHEYIIFSTRIDWLSEYGDIAFDFKEFGSRWLLFNQLSARSIFKDVTRIASGTGVSIDYKRFDIKVKENFWHPDTNTADISNFDFTGKLSSLLNINESDGYKIALGLSGGMDSRVLLSFLLHKGKSSWKTYTFGDEKHPDSLISQKISKDLGFEHSKLNLQLPDIHDCIDEINEYIIHTIVNNPASAIYLLRNNKLLNGENLLIIDGGFGEIWRKEFLNRVYWKGKDALINKNFCLIFPHIRVKRADIFNNEIKDLMFAGCKEQFFELDSKIPPVNEIGVENWLDIIAIKTRLANFYSHEQSRLDNIFTSYMPFAQLSLLKNIFSIPVSQRINGRLFVELIKKNYPSLTKYPRVKSNIIHPFYLNSIQSRIWSLIRSKLKFNIYVDNKRNYFLNFMKEFILDIVNSGEVKETGYYDYAKIKNMAEGYYKGNYQHAEPLDWWLSFEILRRQISKRNN